MAELFSRLSSLNHQRLAQSSIPGESHGTRHDLFRTARRQVVDTWPAVGGQGGLDTPDKRDTREPRIVKLCCRFSQMPTSGKVPDTHDSVDVAVVVPLRRVAYLETSAAFRHQLLIPLPAAQFGGKVSGVSKKRDARKVRLAPHVAGNNARLRPVRHEQRCPQFSGVQRVLHNMDVSTGIGEAVCHNLRNKQTLWGAEARWKTACQRYQDAIARQIMHQFGFDSRRLQRGPCLENPTLGRG